MGEAVLEARELRKRFGGLWAVDGVTLSVAAGQIVGLIGPNGSGKTTLINLFNGVHRPDDGQVVLQGDDVTGRKPHVLAARGIARTFQTARVFSTISVLENMLVPTLHQPRSTGLHERGEELLGFVELHDKRDMAASELSGGQQKLLEFARALMTEPRVVLMDEPFAGVHPSIKELLLERIRVTNETDGTSFVIVSHEVPDLLALSRYAVCLDQGRVISEGSPEQVRDDERVVTAYLGKPVPPGRAP